MARSINSPMGDIRGSIGTITGSRNAAGAFLRKRTTPINPKSPAQVSARNAFRSAGMGWSRIALELRQNWEIFAKAGFNPLKKTNVGQFTGANCYLAIQAAIAGFNNVIASPTVSPYATTPTPSSIDFLPLVVSDVAPLTSVQNNMKNGTIGSIPYKLDAVYMKDDFSVAIDLRLDPDSGFNMTDPGFQDGKDLWYGIAVYFSEALTFVGKRASNAFHSLAGFSGISDELPLYATGGPGLRVAFSAAGPVAKWKQAPALGNIYQATVVVVGSNGTIAVIDKAFLTVASSIPAIPVG